MFFFTDMNRSKYEHLVDVWLQELNENMKMYAICGCIVRNAGYIDMDQRANEKIEDLE